MAKKKKIILPPQLPPEVAEDEVDVSDEDFDFVSGNRGYAGFLNNLDTNSITRHVARVADVEEDALESLYEKRNKKLLLHKQQEEEHGLQVDPVDVLPVKTLDGKLHYRTAKEFDQMPKEDAAAAEDNKDKFAVKLSKPERRKKLKKTKKEAKKQTKEKENDDKDTVMETPQSEVLAEVEEDLTAEEVFLKKKSKLAEIGMTLLEDPESNIKSLKELLQICEDEDEKIVKLGLLSLLAIFKDIIPGYRIRLPTEKELEMTVSKEVKKMRFYESTLLHSYKVYLQKLIALEKKPSFKHVVVRCMCNLLDAVPHFNFRDNLLANVIMNIGSTDDVVRKQCCAAVKSLFTDEGKHGGEATTEAVQMIANHVKIHDCQLPPHCIEVFLHLSFDEDLGRSASKEEENVKHKNKKRKKNEKEQKQPPDNDKKKSKQELMEKTREEVKADFKAASFVRDPEERRRMQSETLSAVFQTYFRILKHTMEATRPRVSTISESGESVQHPLLTPCLSGLGKFSHLINLDFMGDLMTSLKNLASNDESCDAGLAGSHLTVSERLQCCIVAFKVMRNNLDALNVDLQDFFAHLYNLLLEYKPDREGQGEMLAEALKIMLCEGRQHDMQRAAAFIKRLATFSLCFSSAEAIAGLVTVRHLLQKNIKCRNLLENDAGGGSLSGSVAKYQPDASDPNLSGALASVLWELSLLSKHYHPAVSSMASSISSMSTAPNQVFLSTASPPQAFSNLSIERESFSQSGNSAAIKLKRKRGSGSLVSSHDPVKDSGKSIDEEESRKRFSDHFVVLRDISENERLRGELDLTLASLKMYKEYRKQKVRKKEAPKMRKEGLKT